MGAEMGRIKINKMGPVYLGQTILNLSSLVMYKFHYYYILPEYGEKLQLFYMDKDSFLYHIKTCDFYEHIAGNVKRRFDTNGLTTEDARAFPFGKNKNIVGLMKYKVGGKTMTEFVALRAKLYAYNQLDQENPEDKQ